MIAKHIDMRDASKSRATRLAKYVTDELERAGRVADVFTANCISDDALLAAKEIEICQARNTRAKDDKKPTICFCPSLMGNARTRNNSAQ